MLNEYLLSAYRQKQHQQADQRLVEKLAQFPLQDLIDLANGDPTAKLAYCDGPEGPQSWLDKYKGSALFEKAVALEKGLLEADAAADAKRTAERESDRTVDDQRDALRMQKRMLDLDLALEQSGGAPAEAEPAAVAAPVAPAEPAPTGGGTAVEVKQAALLAQFRKIANSAAPWATEREAVRLEEEAQHRKANPGIYRAQHGLAAASGNALLGAQLGGMGARVQRDPWAEEEDEPMDNRGALIGALGGAGIGALQGMAHDPGREEELQAAELRQSLLPHNLRAAHGDLMRQGTNLAEHPGRQRVTRGLIGGGLGALGGAMLGGAAGNPGAGALMGGLAGGGIGALIPPNDGSGHHARAAEVARYLQEKHNEKVSAVGGKVINTTGQEISTALAKTRATKKFPWAKGVALPLAAAGGAYLVGRHLSKDKKKEASATGTFLPETRSLGKTPASDHAQGAGAGDYTPNPSEIVTGGLQVDKVAFSVGGLMQGAKTLGSGVKNLATTAHAAGGLPQVAKSFGSVATSFAKQKPLAAAGIAAGAAGLGGMALGRATAPRQ